MKLLCGAPLLRHLLAGYQGLWGQKKDVGAQDSDDQGGSKATPSPAVAASQVGPSISSPYPLGPCPEAPTGPTAEVVCDPKGFYQHLSHNG